VARVVVDVPLAHLDRPFDYAVPDDLAEAVVAGCRVRVRFSGQLVDGVVLDVGSTTTHTGKRAALAKVVSSEPVLTPEVAELTRAVADRHGGVMTDVLRLALPPRRGAPEKRPVADPPPAPDPPDPAGFARYPTGEAFLEALALGRPVRAVWTALPGEDWPTRLVELCRATLSGGRGALVVVPDGKDLDRLAAAAATQLPKGSVAVLRADSSPDTRYGRFLTVSRGTAQVVLGTRGSVFAPVRDLGLVVVWDDGDDLHAEPRAPYPHTREVLLLRAEREGTAALVGGFSRSVEADHLVRTGWAHELSAPRTELRRRATVAVAGADEHALRRDPRAGVARVPREVFDLLRDGLEHGPVLVQTPRAGYAQALACERCRTPARCSACAGPLGLTGPTTPPACRWCGTPASPWACPECGAHGLRAPVLGEARTAEELGRTFARTRVVTSAGDHVLATVGPEPAIVVATPGAEPVAEGGYAAALLLDGWAVLEREDLRAAEEALRRWAAAAALVRPASAGGAVVLLAGQGVAPVEALVRWDPAWHASRDLAERRELGLPPAAAFARVDGPAAAVDALLDHLQRTSAEDGGLPPHAEVLGPTPAEPDRRPGRERDDAGPRASALVRVPLAQRAALAASLQHAVATRSARKDPGGLRVQLDPDHVG